MQVDPGQRIVCAAVRSPTGLVICGVRHLDAQMHVVLHRIKNEARPFHWEQGFVDNKGNFLTREEAHKIATAAGQIIRCCGNDEDKLWSENLY